jgi:hypothetical protein
MTDRDTFAAAALTGLLAQGDDGSFSEESYARSAYRWADAMLRERERVAETEELRHDGKTCRTDGDVTEPMPVVVSGSGFVTPVSYAENDEKRCFFTIQDAVPAAIVSTTDENSLHAASELGNPGAASRQGEVTGNTQEPVAWAVYCGDSQHLYDHYDGRDEADAIAAMLAGDDRGDSQWHTVPLYRQPQPTLIDAEREAASLVSAAIKDREWIPMAERLPDDAKSVLLLIDTGHGIRRCVAYWCGDEQEWIRQACDRRAGELPAGDVTHWMPLPAPPSDGK